MFIRDIYHKDPIVIYETDLIKDAVRMMNDHEFNGFVVLDTSRRVVGVLSLQDIAGATIPLEFRNNIQMAIAMYRKGFFEEMCKSIAAKMVKEIMREDFISVSFSTNIMAITADFLHNDLYIVPVIEKGELVGVVTRSQIKKAISHAMELDKTVSTV